MRAAVFVVSLLLCSVAAANTAIIIDLGNGNYVGVLLTDNGAIPISKVNIVKLNPTPPPVPTNVTSAAIIYESGETDQNFAILRTQIQDASLPIILMDKDTTNELGQQDPLIAAAKDHISSLPVVVGYSGDGSAVASEPVPATAREVADLLKKWGLR